MSDKQDRPGWWKVYGSVGYTALVRAYSINEALDKVKKSGIFDGWQPPLRAYYLDDKLDAAELPDVVRV